MPITMEDILNNPTGKGSAGLARRDIIRENLIHRYEKIRNKVRCKVSSFEDGTKVFVLDIPSESYYDVFKLTYQVVLTFSVNETTINNLRKAGYLNNYDMQMYSNSPNFMYTYAYVYNADGLIQHWLLKKLPMKALTEVPSVRNPQLQYGYEKSVYFSLLYIKENGLNKISFLGSTPKVTPNKIIRDVPSSEAKLEEYEKIKKKASSVKKASKVKKNTKLLARAIGGNQELSKLRKDRMREAFRKIEPSSSTGKRNSAERPKKDKSFRVIKPKRKMK